jgi:type II secretory pathway pseudopilin PulG
MTAPGFIIRRAPARTGGFSLPDLLVLVAIVALLASIGAVLAKRSKQQSNLALCVANLGRVDKAILAFANDNSGNLPGPEPDSKNDHWWFYKEQIKKYAGLGGASSPYDTVFACPDDRGYSEKQPFHLTPRFDFTSYVFNGVTLPGLPNIAGAVVSSVRKPARTLLVMEWTAHAPLSWHHSRTGAANGPFYNDAESVTAFVDGHAALTKIYYDGYNAAYTRDPISSYDYQYSGQ